METDHSKPLKNPKHEAFAHELLEQNQSAAYRTVYPKARRWKAQAVYNMAHALTQKVTDRVNWLKEQATERAIGSKVEAITDIVLMSRTKMSDVMEYRGGVVALRDFDDIDAEHMGSIKKMRVRTEVTKAGVVTTTDVEMYDRLKANELKCRIFGAFELDNEEGKPESDLAILLRKIDKNAS